VTGLSGLGKVFPQGDLPMLATRGPLEKHPTGKFFPSIGADDGSLSSHSTSSSQAATHFPSPIARSVSLKWVHLEVSEVESGFSRRKRPFDELF